MIRQPHITDLMTDKEKEAYFAQKTISREIDPSVVLGAVTGQVGREVNDFTPDQKADVRKADDLL